MSGAVRLDVKGLGITTRFQVGDIVEASRRKGPGVNRQGGAARIAAVSFNKDGNELYDISYINYKGTEDALPVSILKSVSQSDARPRRFEDALANG